MSTEQMMSVAFGSAPLATGAQTVTKHVYAFEANEDTTFGVFTDSKDVEITTHPWKGKVVKSDKTAWFGIQVYSFTITAGGAGQVFLSE